MIEPNTKRKDEIFEMMLDKYEIYTLEKEDEDDTWYIKEFQKDINSLIILALKENYEHLVSELRKKNPKLSGVKDDWDDGYNKGHNNGFLDCIFELERLLKVKK